jgi:hypothetical protein
MKLLEFYMYSVLILKERCMDIMIKLWMLLTIGQNISLVNFEKFRKWPWWFG